MYLQLYLTVFELLDWNYFFRDIIPSLLRDRYNDVWDWTCVVKYEKSIKKFIKEHQNKDWYSMMILFETLLKNLKFSL